MGVGVSQRSTAPERRSPTAGRPSNASVALAAATGAVGPVVMALGQGPVTLADDTRPAALLTVVAIAVLTAVCLARVTRPGPSVTLPALLVVGSLATWPTLGRLEGAWCVLAVAAAVAVVDTLRGSDRSPTTALLALLGLTGTAAAGWVWARSGPSPEAAAVLGLSATVGALVPRSRSVVTTGDRWLERSRDSAAVLWRATLVGARRARRQVGRLPALAGGTAASRRVGGFAGAVTGIVMFPLFLVLTSDTSRTSIFTDFELHMTAAESTRLLPFTTLTPHWLFQVLTAIVRPLTGVEVGAAVVLAGSCGLSVAVLCGLAGRSFGVTGAPAPIAAALIGTTAFWLDSPTAFLNTVGWLDPARTFAPIHAWGSPTDTLAFPLLLLLVIAVVRFLDEPDVPWFRVTPARLVLAGLTVATLLTKPNVPMIMLGVVPIAILLRHGRTLGRLAAAAAWLAVPTVTVLALQYRHMQVSEAISQYDPGGWGVTVEPFAFLDLWPAAQGGLWFGLSMPVVWLLGAWVLGRRFWLEPVMAVAQLTLLVSMVPMVLLRETGLHSNDGNFTKAGYGAAMVLVALTAVEVGRELWFQRTPDATWTAGQRARRMALSSVVAASFLLGGVAVYLATLAPDLLPGPIWPGP